MRQLYSENFTALQNFSGTWWWTPVSDAILVLRDVDLSYDGGLGLTYRLLGTLGQTIDRADFGVTGSELHQWRGRQVIPAGYRFGVSATDGCDITVSGYRLLTP